LIAASDEGAEVLVAVLRVTADAFSSVSHFQLQFDLIIIALGRNKKETVVVTARADWH
jgi:hypothetical protein